jgi:L-fuconolactonase
MVRDERTLTRRDFMQGWAGLAIAGTFASVERGRRVIDTHTHFYDIDRPQGVPWPPRTEPVLYRTHLPPEFARLTARLGVVGTVVVEASPWLEDNQWVLDLAKESPGIVGFVGNLAVGESDFGANLRRFARQRLFRGLRLGERALVEGVGRVKFLDDLRRLAGEGLALDALVGLAGLAAVERVAREIPSLRIIVDHLPFVPLDQDPEGARRRIGPLAARPNIYAKVSNVIRQREGAVVTAAAEYGPRLDLLWDLFGQKRLVYGSNWPVSNRVSTYEEQLRVVADYFQAKGAGAADDYFYGNSRRFYRWIERR